MNVHSSIISNSYYASQLGIHQLMNGLKECGSLGMVTLNFSTSTQRAETGRSMYLRPVFFA